MWYDMLGSVECQIKQDFGEMGEDLGFSQSEMGIKRRF